jgi:RND family efflux transporter MFP subunit
MQTIKTILTIAAIPFIMSSCSTKKEAVKTADTDVIPVKIMSLAPTTGSASVNVSGQFTTDDEANLSFKTGGIINKIYVREGDAVQQGQLLATLNMAEINAQVEQAHIAYEKATRDYQRVVNLYKDSVATLEQTQNTKTGMDMARQQVTSAEFNRNYSEIRAPRSGYVLRKMMNEGQLASTGAAVFQINGAKAGNWMLRAGVSDKEWSNISINDKAEIIITALNGKAYTGEVSRKAEGADPLTGAYAVDIKFTGDKPSNIAAGMFGKAIISTRRKNEGAASSWAIPYDALLDGNGSNGFVFVTNDDKTVQKIKVTVASIEKDVVIISDGLQNAKSLIISGSAYLTEKSAIKVIADNTVTTR